MKRPLFFLLIFLFVPLLSFAQEEDSEEEPDGWSTSGRIQFLFNQSAFNAEWTGGGTSNISGNLLLDYDFSYRQGDLTWDNKIIANYGLTRTNGDDFTKKTSDRLELNSIVGKEFAESNWSYTFFANFRTQFAPGYNYGTDPDTGEAMRTETSHFLSPAYLQAGPGLMWRKNENLFVNIAPATARFIFVDSFFTSTPGYVDGDYFGVDSGKSMRFELGASVSAFAKYDLVENVTMEHNLSLYSNYLEDPGNVDIDYLLNIDMSINEYLSTNLIFQAIYDDNAVGAFQIREVFGVGFNLTL